MKIRQQNVKLSRFTWVTQATYNNIFKSFLNRRFKTYKQNQQKTSC